MVSVASEVAAAKGWLPGYFEFYFKGKAMAEAAASRGGGRGQCVRRQALVHLRRRQAAGERRRRAASGYGAAIEEILSNAIITKIADVLPGLLKVGLRQLHSGVFVEWFHDQDGARSAIAVRPVRELVYKRVAINEAAGAETTTPSWSVGGQVTRCVEDVMWRHASPQGALVADARSPTGGRSSTRASREREVEDAAAALRYVRQSSSTPTAPSRRGAVHRFRDRAVRRPQERHLVAQPPDVDDGELPERESAPHGHDALRDGSRHDARPVDDVREPHVLRGYDAGTAGPQRAVPQRDGVRVLIGARLHRQLERVLV